MSWIVYAISPIDWHWEHLQTVEDFARKISGKNLALRLGRDGDIVIDDEYYGEDISLDEFLDDWKSAREAAHSEGWEGDFRQGPVVFWIPDDTNFRYGFAFKQDNNGTTFIISPVRMPWLDQLT